jgi:[acyl-carrier-protein] S-malonyltransferase
MGKDLYDASEAARQVFDAANRVLDFDLAAICFNGPEQRLNQTDISQPALYTAGVASFRAAVADGRIDPAQVTAYAGLSLGEYTALAFAGAFAFEDGVKLVQARGRAMQDAAEATPSGMVSVLGMEVPDVEALVIESRGSDTLEVANLLCPGNAVVSGSLPAIDRFEQLCVQKGGIRTVRLAVAGAFHTRLMKPADEKLAAALANASLSAPRVPVWSNVDARPHTDPNEIRDLLVKQVLSPVRWEDTLRGLLADNVDRFYEIGPGRVLAGLIKRVLRKADIRNVAA